MGALTAIAPAATRPDHYQGDGEEQDITRGFAATLVALGLLLLGLAYDGLFLVRFWVPVAVVVLTAVIVVGARHLPLHARTGVLFAWAFALYSGASALWAHLPGAALEGGGRTAFYVALLTLPIVGLRSPGAARTAASAVVAGLGIASYAVLAMLLFGDGSSLMLAGRLNEPIGYRNGTAAFFAAAAVALVVATAARSVPVLVRAVAGGGAVAALGLVVLTQSRGVVAAGLLGLLVVVLLGPDRLRRAWTAVAAVAVVAAISPRLGDPYDRFVEARITDPSAVDGAAGTLAVAVGGAVLLVLALAVCDRGLRTEAIARRVRRGAVGLLAVGTLLAAVGGLVAIGSPVDFVDRKMDEFTAVDGASTTAGGARLGSVGGQRYDLWRVALREFGDHPILGAGESSYRVGYYRHRRTDRNLTSAHSLPLGLAAELGVAGILLALAASLALLVPILRSWRSLASGEDARWISAVLGVAAVLVGQSMLDWIWTIPLLGGLAAFCVGVAVAAVPSSEGTPRAAAWRWAVPACATVALAVVAASYVGNAYVREAREARLAGDPQVQLDRARTAQRFVRWDPQPRYLAAGALEALGQRAAARAQLRRAVALEPEHYVGYALLGDLETRAGDVRAARAWYRRALSRNPSDAGLAQLARR